VKWAVGSEIWAGSAAEAGATRREVSSREDPAKLKQAASQFEALLIGQMLREFRESGQGGGLEDGDDEAGSSLMEIAEGQFAQVLAAKGGLGLSDTIVKHLSGSSNATGVRGRPE